MDHQQHAARASHLDAAAVAGTPELGDYLSVLRRRRWTVIQTIVVVAAAVAGLTLWQIPVYESSVRLVVHPGVTATGADTAQDAVLDQRVLETQVELIVSTAVAEVVIDKLGLQRSPEELVQDVDAGVVGDTNVVEITARSASPERAAELAQGFADGYLEFRWRRQQENAAEAVSSLQARMQEVRESLAEVQARKAGASGAQLVVIGQEEAALLDELSALSSQLAFQRSRQDFAGVGGDVIQPARVPSAPSSPDLTRNGVLALILGTVLGVGLAFVRDSLDDGLRTKEDVERAAGEPVVGEIPAWRQKERDGPQLVTITAPASPATEAYGTLRTNVRFLAVGRSFRSLLVTSAIQGEGKTTTASNLAVAFALAGSEVLLVGADLRRPQLHRVFGRGEAPGLSDVLAGDCALEEAMVDVGVPNLRVLPSGHLPPNPAELFACEAMTAVMGKVEQLADLVIYDGPPVLATADALELSARVGAVLLVVDAAARPGRSVVQAAAERIRNVGGPMVGTIMTRVDGSETYYGHHHRYG